MDEGILVIHEEHALAGAPSHRRARRRAFGPSRAADDVEERLERVEFAPEAPFDVVHGVDQPGVHLDLSAADHPDAAGNADARLVVAIDVRAHGQLGLVLRRREEGDDLGGVADRVVTAGDRPRDRAGLHAIALDAHVHLGRGADEIFRFAEVHEEAVRRGVAFAQADEQLGRWRGTALQERLTRDDLEEIAARERLTRETDHGRILPGSVIAPAGGPYGPDVRLGGPRARKALGRAARHLEVVAPAHGDLPAVVDDDQLVGEIEDEVALLEGALAAWPGRLGLEGESV